MSGYAMVLSACFGCKQIFSYNPHLVPSLRYPQPDGPRQPICRACVERVNPRRIQNGLDPIEILPGAYEPIAEEEL